MSIYHQQHKDQSNGSAQVVRPEIKELQDLSNRLANSVASATATFPSLIYPALVTVLPIEHILQQMEIDAASGSSDEVAKINGKIPALKSLVTILVGEFDEISKAYDKDEVDKIWSKLPADARKIPEWYYGNVAVTRDQN